MDKRKFFFLLILIPVVVNAQRFYRGKRYRYEMIYSLGASNFLGELGGANRIGTTLWKDLDVPATRPVIGCGLRYRVSPHFSVKGSLFAGMLYGNDKLTQEAFRNNRNLNFRSLVIELGGQTEFYLKKERPGRLYAIKNAKGFRRTDLRTYFFTGASVIFFNPQGNHNGTWVNLQPLGTEGQGIDPSKRKYSRFNVAIPIGIGTKYKLNRRYSVGVEVGLRKTFTDYIDDVSTVYYDNTTIADNKGNEAAKLADPSLGLYPNSTMAGQQRGNPSNKDSYMFFTVNVNYRIYKLKRSTSKF